MAEDSKIQWTSHTFNCWRGCTKVSEGCRNCYAETLSGRNPATLGVWGPNGTRVVASESQWREPVKWNKVAALAEELAGVTPPPGVTVLPYQRPRVFCASLADVFEAWDGPMIDSAGRRLFVAPSGKWSNDGTGEPVTEAGWRPLTMGDVRARLFDLISATTHLDWLLLTKRPENVLRMAHDAWCCPVPGHVSQNPGDGYHWKFPSNVWVGTTVEDQDAADKRIPHLLKIPAAVRFLSCEPLLGPLDLRRYLVQGWCPQCRTTCFVGFPEGRGCGGCGCSRATNLLGWAIVGGESGHGARPFSLDWGRSLVRQCKDAGVSCFIKQMGENVEDCNNSVGRFTLKLMDKKGGDINEFPAELRVREFPHG